MAKFPLKDEPSAEHIIQYQVDATDRNQATGMSRLIEHEVSRNYTLGNQWLEVADSSDSTFENAVTPMSSGSRSLPQPVMNKTAAIVDGEAARLISSTLKPRVDPNDRTTRVARASRLSGQILDDFCAKNQWVRISHQDRRDSVIYGTSFMLTSLDLDVEDMSDIPSPMYGCQCGWKVAASVASMEDGTLSVKGKAAEAMGASIPESASDEERARGPIAFANKCPKCNGRISESVAPDGESTDSYGNSLVKKVPATKISVRNVSVYDVCPEGGGRSNNGELSEYTIESIMPIDWVTRRHQKGKEVTPKTLHAMNNILRWHPSGIDYSGTGGYFSGPANLSEERWAAYRMTVRQPFYNTETKEYEPDGRLIISANDTVLYHGPLMIHHPESGRRIPRVMLHAAQYLPVEGSIWGVGIPKRIRKLQDAINTCIAQAQYARHVWGNPRMFLPQGTNIEYLGQAYGDYQGDSFSYSGDKAPEMSTGSALHPDWHSEISMYLTEIGNICNQADIDRGIPPGGVPSASGLMYLGEQAGTARKPISQRFAEREARIFRHVLELANATYNTPQQLMVADRGDKRTVKTFTGTDLMWQVDVKVEVQPAFDSAVFRRQATQEALQNQLLVPSTPLQRRKIAESLGVPPEADAVPSQQIESAENEWLDYALSDDPIEPIVKPAFDHHPIHIEQHFSDLRSADGEPLTKFWNMVELATTGWQEMLSGIENAEAQLKADPPDAPMPDPPLDPMGNPSIAASLMMAEKRAHMLQVKKTIDQLPRNKELRIFQIMGKLLQEDQSFNELDQDNKADAMMFVRWLCHIEAHKAEESRAMASQAMGMPMPEAPGGAPGTSQVQ